MNTKFYDGTKLLSMTDLNKNKPEIYMCVGNRTAGKTFFFKRLLLRRYVKNKAKFIVLVRFALELEGIAENFFSDLERDCQDFTGHNMEQKMIGKTYCELLYDGELCGYGLAINNADTLKKYSARFSDAQSIFFDEFQSETNKYCSKELDKFQSIHVSVARGGGSSVRYVPVYMCSNNASVLNPYYSVFGVHRRLTEAVKFLRGDGWVLEQTFNSVAATALRDSGFGRAFNGSNYIKYSTDNQSLLDNSSFIEKVSGYRVLKFVFKYGGNKYGIWQCEDNGWYYISEQYDPSWKNIIALSNDDHSPNFVLLNKSNPILRALMLIYEQGGMRFETLSCKASMLEILGFMKG